MLPTPAATVWSSSVAFTGRLLARMASANGPGCKSSGSGPSRSPRKAVTLAASGNSSALPNRRTSRNRSSRPSSSGTRRCRWSGTSAPAATTVS